jgi:hypothetical protein
MEIEVPPLPNWRQLLACTASGDLVRRGPLLTAAPSERRQDPSDRRDLAHSGWHLVNEFAMSRRINSRGWFRERPVLACLSRSTYGSFLGFSACTRLIGKVGKGSKAADRAVSM